MTNSGPGLAVRLDASTGVEHRIEYVPTDRGQMYVSTSRPVDARACVLTCSSILGDFAANYHRERLLGQALSSRGYGSIRFHYAGEGNSQGDRRMMTFESMCEDTRAVLEYGSSLGFEKFGMLGTRIGALVAAATITSEPTVPLALWEPVADSKSFISDAQRAKRMSQMTLDEGQTPQVANSFGQEGVIDVLGYDVHPNLIESLKSVDLLSCLGPITRPLFIARFRSGSTGRDNLVDTLTGRGFEVDAGHFGLAESWWFDRTTTLESGDLIANTTSWLSKGFGEI